MEIEKIGFVLVGVILGIQSFWDVKDREILVRLSLLGALIGIIVDLLVKRSLLSVMFAILPGVTLLVLSRITREAIGYGDGILILVMGFFYRVNDVLSIILLAFVLAGLVGLFLLVILRKKGKYEIPFVPFLFVAWMVDIGMRI